MKEGSRNLILILLFFSLTVGFVSAGSSVGSGPGLSSLPTSFSWEGDSVLNGDDAGDFFDFSSSTSSILDEAEAAGMVMYNTGVPESNVTNSGNNTTVNKTANVNVTDSLSGYASVGDIIKDQDWDALQRYTSSVESTSEMPKSQLSQETRSNLWNTLFTEPQVISCGGCS